MWPSCSNSIFKKRWDSSEVDGGITSSVKSSASDIFCKLDCELWPSDGNCWVCCGVTWWTAAWKIKKVLGKAKIIPKYQWLGKLIK